MKKEGGIKNVALYLKKKKTFKIRKYLKPNQTMLVAMYDVARIQNIECDGFLLRHE